MARKKFPTLAVKPRTLFVIIALILFFISNQFLSNYFLPGDFLDLTSSFLTALLIKIIFKKKKYKEIFWMLPLTSFCLLVLSGGFFALLNKSESWMFTEFLGWLPLMFIPLVILLFIISTIF